MSLTLTPVPSANTVFGNKRIRVFDATVTSSAATIAPSDVGLHNIDFVVGLPATAPTTFLWVASASTLGVGTGRVAFVGY